MTTFKVKIFSLITALMLVFAVNGSALANDWWVDVRNDRVKNINETISQGQDPNALNSDGHTALTYAYREGALKSFDALINHPDVDINKQNSYHESPIMYPALANDIERVKVLVEKGAKLNHIGWSPIHYAAIKGNAEIVKILLDNGAWPNSPAPDGSNPLMMAVSVGSRDAVAALVAAGADPKAVNFEGVSALDLAKERNNRKMIELLTK